MGDVNRGYIYPLMAVNFHMGGPVEVAKSSLFGEYPLLMTKSLLFLTWPSRNS